MDDSLSAAQNISLLQQVSCAQFEQLSVVFVVSSLCLCFSLLSCIYLYSVAFLLFLLVLSNSYPRRRVVRILSCTVMAENKPIYLTSAGSESFTFPTSMLSAESGGQHAGAVIAKLEDVFAEVADCLLAERKLVIHMRTRVRRAKQILDSTTGVLVNADDGTSVDVVWPGSTPREGWKFCKSCVQCG